ncbi:DUF4352 domain-containing protein [Bacillus mycoides]|uniref:DUF4352 domain-containing protein n=1 Tax=Bacillus mycoides TaxID=1405 RepID=UPI0002798C20|nr:DUF4352 domain-containing protein [Bacillus mycoides]EJS10634.1 hypothetical protein IKO_00424 [Bacillus cereus VDM034]EJS12304.1 hypothetical protein IKS_04766 [Bacillus cereus VDM062]MBG9684430.1 hypothetical protein [Bacillus mycoides]QWI20719.1 DUF4352 domain-containing protein [Bacillus mycoides]
MNKKLLTSLLCSTFLFGLSACSSHDTSSSNGEVKAQGIFKVLDVAVYNRQEEPITLNSNNFKLIDGTGREYHISNESQLVLKAANTATFKFGVLNPNENSEGNIVFDVPKNTQGLTLKINGDMLGEGIELKVE